MRPVRRARHFATTAPILFNSNEVILYPSEASFLQRHVDARDQLRGVFAYPGPIP